MIIPRRAGTAAVAALLGAALTGCGGSSSHHHTPNTSTSTAVRATVGGLPGEAKVVFASDSALPIANVSSARLGGRLVASTGFVPGRDGFSFQNYGFIAGQDLDAAAMRELFGDRVCATAPSDSCTLTPAAEQWALANDANLAGGHCFGFSLTALRFFRHTPAPSGFGAGTTYALPFTRALQSLIAADFITQYLPPVNSESRAFTPSELVSFLERAMADRGGPLYSIGFYSPDRSEGHAVTPIGVQDLGGGRVDILIYDNNKPNTTQAIAIDTRAETWSYLVGVNPSAPQSTWDGQGATNEIQLTPLSAVTQAQPCPFCTTGSRTATNTISLGGDPVNHAHLLIATADGHRLGFVHGRLVNDIPGARVIVPLLSDITKAHPEAIFQVPARYRLIITVEHGPASSPPATVYITGPGFGDAIENLMPGPSSGATISVAPAGGPISLRLTGTRPAQTPTLQLARDQGRGGRTLAATPTTLGPGTRLSVGLRPAAGRVSVASSGAGLRLALTLRTVTSHGTRTVTNRSAGAGTLSLGLIKIG